LRILETIQAEQPLSQTRLGDLTGTDRTTIVAIVDKLEALGAAVRNRDPNDRRSHAVMLTSSGARVLAEARKLALAAEQHFLAPLAPAERSTLHSLLSRLHQPTTCPEEKSE
jgi:DNA-binding MarR family transcriptional regulator